MTSCSFHISVPCSKDYHFSLATLHTFFVICDKVVINHLLTLKFILDCARQGPYMPYSIKLHLNIIHKRHKYGTEQAFDRMVTEKKNVF